jgi:hypothetical protein
MIIGIMGFLGSGKGTVADILIKNGFYKFSFADTLKDVVSTIFLWPRDLLEGDTEPSRVFREKVDPWWTERFGYEVTPRKMLQIMGTEAGRDVIHKDIWLHCLERRIQGYPNVVIPDVRFPNECNFIRKMGGQLIRVKRGEDLEHALALNRPDLKFDIRRWEYFMLENYPKVHASEWAWLAERPDYIIENNGTLDDLKAEVEKILTSVNV